ncbi:putative DNA primase [Achromobacter phage vB_AxyP_19-32_Axy22]|uniref:Putative DNA primase n=1 Tax=Achromobacter phage vB_AxyP_19-32_Axy22 TaxID=2591046 RepID=A0A514CVV8_9CAUD|nr:putative DNA primase [Achromobacter phage vB_AxyP_19-32_Axy22]
MSIDLTGVTHHPAIEQIVDVLCNKTQNTDRGFFRVEAAYFLAKMAASQRATIVTKDRGEIPVNIYALALATSGYGKGHSVNIVETEFLAGFKKRFVEETMPLQADQHLWYLANSRAARNGSDQQEEYDKLAKEYHRQGTYPFTFDSGTAPAVKQLRHRLLLANCGSINLQIDEIGSNLVNEVEVLNVFLELYDQGMVKLKLVKNTADNTRGEELDGKTPANMLLFGTPSKLLDGGQTENLFYDFLETGYARRCIFGIGQQDRKAIHSQTPEEIYKRLTDTSNSSTVSHWATHFHSLAAPTKFGWKMQVEDDVGIALIAYKADCEMQAEAMADHEEIRKAEISHRYFKALKLAGALAFVDESMEIEMDHLKQAILLVEESGAAFQSILNREKTYVKLAKYLASVGTEQTHADLLEALPFYKSGNAARNEMMTLAIAWGYKQHIIIKKTYVDGIDFFRGESLKETDLSDMMLSYSDNWAYGYSKDPNKIPFDKLHILTQAPDMHWANHYFKKDHRAEENAIAGFNMIVIDVDGDVSLETCHELMKDYKFMTYTTKRHTEEENRFRLILPMNYTLELDSEEYKEFMNNVMEWLPFKTDESANQRSKKWMTCDQGSYHYNMDAPLLDVRDFIPRTTKNEQFKQGMQKVESLDNLERWFAQRIATGNRNNHMLKFALALVDSGKEFGEVRTLVHAFNKKLNNPLDSDELDSTVLVTAAKRYNANN